MIRLRALEIVVTTSEGRAGFRHDFTAGLNVLRAPNNSGKSTVMQAVVYALGLEGMFSSSREIPLPHAITDRIELDGREVPVVASHVTLELENGLGQIQTFQRAVVDPVLDRHLVITWDGAMLTSPDPSIGRQDYFVRRPGAAVRDAGFHHYLAGFVGWDLPEVQYYDGSERPLYMEALFPLIFVEQKQGWGGVRPRVPTYLGIRDVGKRAVEFTLDLSTLDRARQRAELEQRLREITREWSEARAHLSAVAEGQGGRLSGVPTAPTTWSDALRPRVQFIIDDATVELDQMILRHESQLAQMPADPPLAENEAPQLGDELNERSLELRVVLGQAAATDEALSLAENEAGVLDRRIDATREDRQRLLDIRLLESLGSPLGIAALVDHDCPTCHQTLDNVGLADGESPLSIDDNVRLLEQRLIALNGMRDAASQNVNLLALSSAAARERAAELRRRIRAVKAALVQPGTMPSIASIERRLSITVSLDNLASLRTATQTASDEFERLAGRADSVRSVLRALGGEYADEDQRKIAGLETLVRSQLQEYGFGSLPVAEVAISRETLHPSHEGFDLGFDISASDGVRTKWAYFLGLAEVGTVEMTNHPRLLIFDEPGQQEIDRASLAALLRHCSRVADRGVQIVIATSEVQSFLEGVLGPNTGQIVRSLDGKLLQPLS